VAALSSKSNDLKVTSYDVNCYYGANIYKCKSDVLMTNVKHAVSLGIAVYCVS